MSTAPSTRTWHLRGLVLVVVGVLALVWLIGAVGLIGASGDSADRAYLVVPLTAMVGASLSRLRAPGLALTAAVMAIEMAVIGAVAMLGGWVPDFNSPWEIVGLTLGFAAVFGAAAAAFHRAAPRPHDGPVGGDA